MITIDINDILWGYCVVLDSFIDFCLDVFYDLLFIFVIISINYFISFSIFLDGLQIIQIQSLSCHFSSLHKPIILTNWYNFKRKICRNRLPCQRIYPSYYYCRVANLSVLAFNEYIWSDLIKLHSDTIYTYLIAKFHSVKVKVVVFRVREHDLQRVILRVVERRRVKAMNSLSKSRRVLLGHEKFIRQILLWSFVNFHGACFIYINALEAILQIFLCQSSFVYMWQSDISSLSRHQFLNTLNVSLKSSTRWISRANCTKRCLCAPDAL